MGWVISYSPLPFYPHGKDPGTHRTGRWVDSEPIRSTYKIFCPCRESNLESSVLQLVVWSLNGLHYPCSIALYLVWCRRNCTGVLDFLNMKDSISNNLKGRSVCHIVRKILSPKTVGKKNCNSIDKNLWSRNRLTTVTFEIIIITITINLVIILLLLSSLSKALWAFSCPFFVLDLVRRRSNWPRPCHGTDG